MPDDLPPRDGLNAPATTQRTPRVWPHNIEAEHALLGALLVSNAAMGTIANQISEQDFFDPVHGRIFHVIDRLIQKKALASPITVEMHMQADEGLKQLGGGAYLAGLAAGIVSLRAASDYAATIRELSIRRAVIANAEQMIADATSFEPDRSIEEIATDAEQAMAETLKRIGGESRPALVPFLKATASAIKRADEAMRHGAGAPTPWRALNDRIGGLMDGDLTIVAGRPSMGKSALAISLAGHIAAEGRHVVYASLEMPPEDICLRVTSEHMARSGQNIPFRRVRMGDVSKEEFYQAIDFAKDFAPSISMTIVDMHIRRRSRLEAEIRRAVSQARRSGEQVGAIVVDYVGLLRSDDRGVSRYELVTEMTGAMKALAGELSAPVIGISQLSRKVEDRDDKRPMLSDLRDSGSVEQDADNVMLIYREEYYLERAQPPETDAAKWSEWYDAYHRSRGKMEVIVAKQRNGPTGTATLFYDPATNRIQDDEARS